MNGIFWECKLNILWNINYIFLEMWMEYFSSVSVFYGMWVEYSLEYKMEYVFQKYIENTPSNKVLQ